jgi:hypothetical protein
MSFSEIGNHPGVGNEYRPRILRSNTHRVVHHQAPLPQLHPLGNLFLRRADPPDLFHEVDEGFGVGVAIAEGGVLFAELL